MESKTNGLFLGKFAPFHKGHQFVVESALKEVDRLIILVYDAPETTDIPLTVRAEWIRTLYPDVEVIEGWNSPAETGYTEEIMRKQENYVLDMLNRRRITHFFSSEPYGEHMSKALEAKNCIVDLDRNIVSISATQIRENPFKKRHFLAPEVYKDLITHVVFMGAESTGKSTITKEMARRFDTVYMPEYGQEFWEKHQVDMELTIGQLVDLANGHIERENILLYEANKYLFTDTNAITTYIFSMHYHGQADPKLQELANKCAQRYDLVFLCDIDIPYDDTPDRLGKVVRKKFHEKTIQYLNERNIPFILLRGNLEERVAKVGRVLTEFEKYQNAKEIIDKYKEGELNAGKIHAGHRTIPSFA